MNLYSKRTGYFIYFKRNDRKINNKSSVNIINEDVARKEFFKIIRETTIEV